MKLIIKGGDVAGTVQGLVDDAATLANPAATPVQKVIAGVSLASEFAPVSIGDLKDLKNLAEKGVEILKARKQTERALDSTRGAAKTAETLGDVNARANTVETPAPSAANQYKGGPYGEMRGPKGDNLDAHEMPPQGSVNPRSENPSIQMEKVDHKETSSYGGGKAADSYRKEIRDLWNSGDQGKRKAMAEEVKDVRSAAQRGSGDQTKYNAATRQMLDRSKQSKVIPSKSTKEPE